MSQPIVDSVRVSDAGGKHTSSSRCSPAGAECPPPVTAPAMSYCCSYGRVTGHKSRLCHGDHGPGGRELPTDPGLRTAAAGAAPRPGAAPAPTTGTRLCVNPVPGICSRGSSYYMSNQRRLQVHLCHVYITYGSIMYLF